MRLSLPLRHCVMVLALISAIVTVAGSFGAAPAKAADGFVGRAGTQFTLESQPFQPAGTNNHYLVWGSKQEIDNVLNDAAAMHLNVIRTIGGPVMGSLDGSTVPTIWKWPNAADSSNMQTNGAYMVYWDSAADKMAFNDGPNGIQKLDYTIAKAHDLNIKVLVAFLDFWEFTGGAQQMNAWYGSSDRYTFFFSDPRTQQDYKDWVAHLLNHVNTITGIAYKDDPTIFAWDLMNEPQASSIGLAQQWISEMSAYVKSIDPTHLVGSGTEGGYSGQAGSDPVTEAAIPTIDFSTWHIYPANMQIRPQQVTDLIGQHCATAAQVGKPVLLEEFGYGAQNADQTDVYRSWTDALYNNANCAGWLFWRLTSTQDSDKYPADAKDHYDVHNDGSATAELLQSAAVKFQQRASVQSSSVVCANCEATAAPTLVTGISVATPDSPPDQQLVVPHGTPNSTYYAAFPVTMQLNGDLTQWQTIPQERVSSGPAPAANPAEDGTIAFSAAADNDNLYFLFLVTDLNIVSGKHDQQWWKEDSIELYLNGTGDLTLTSYQPGVFDLNIPSQNIGRAPTDPLISTQQTVALGTKAYVFKTTTGYGAQVAIPLKNSQWNITPTHGGALGLQVQLNGASQLDRDTILIWSDTPNAAKSSEDPSAFGELIFYQVHQDAAPTSVMPIDGVRQP